jgi:hypothetical protein
MTRDKAHSAARAVQWNRKGSGRVPQCSHYDAVQLGAWF